MAVIISNPQIMSGAPCFQGTRVPLQNLIDYLEGGETIAAFLEQFPTVKRDQVTQAIEEMKLALFTKVNSAA